jgi:hypothetical protein
MRENVHPEHTAFVLQTQSMFDAFRPDIPFFIYTDHTREAHRRQIGGGAPAPASAAWRAKERALYCRADTVFTLSEFCARSVIEDYGVPAERVLNVSTGINMDLPGADGLKVEREPVILFVGGHWQIKGGPQLLDAFRTHARAEIEKETDTVFKRLIWKREHFDHVTISDTYALDVIDRFGGNALRELSAGERQVLSLAFIVAMTTVADHEAPLVIDTPFGRISREVQEHLAERLPSAAPQLVLLLTDSELNPEAEKILDQYVGHKAVLDFDESNSSTSLTVVK